MTEPEVFEPLVPPEVDLRQYPFMPLFRARLFASEFHATANAEEWRAGVTLWLKSWDQVPAGTLPPGDHLLARLAELPIADWRAVRDRALHGWQLCSDGRLHHAVLAEIVMTAWKKFRSDSKKGKKAAAKRWGNKKKSNNATGMPQAYHEHANRDGDRDRDSSTPDGVATEKSPSKNGSAGHAPSATLDHSQWVITEGLRWLSAEAKRRPDTIRSLIGKWRQELHNDDAKLRAIFEAAISTHPAEPISWITKAVETRAKQNGHTAPAADPDALSEEDLMLARLFGGIATDTLNYRRVGIWGEDRNGPRPDAPGTRVPIEILSRHGYADPGIYTAWKERHRL